MPEESGNHRFLLFRGSNGTDQSSRSGLFHADRQSIYFHCAGCKQLFRCKADLLGRHIIDVGGQLIAKLRMPVFRLPEHSPQAVGYREVFISQPVSDGLYTHDRHRGKARDKVLQERCTGRGTELAFDFSAVNRHIT